MFYHRKARGQSSMEYVFAVALILGFVISLMITGMRESEFNLATAAARGAAREWVAGNESVYLASLEVSQSGRSVKFTPAVYYWRGGSNARLSVLPNELKRAVILAVQRTAAPSSPQPEEYCFNSVNYDYCVADA